MEHQHRLVWQDAHAPRPGEKCGLKLDYMKNGLCCFDFKPRAILSQSSMPPCSGRREKSNYVPSRLLTSPPSQPSKGAVGQNPGRCGPTIAGFESNDSMLVQLLCGGSDHFLTFKFLWII